LCVKQPKCDCSKCVTVDSDCKVCVGTTSRKRLAVPLTSVMAKVSFSPTTQLFADALYAILEASTLEASGVTKNGLEKIHRDTLDAVALPQVTIKLGSAYTTEDPTIGLLSAVTGNHCVASKLHAAAT